MWVWQPIFLSDSPSSGGDMRARETPGDLSWHGSIHHVSCVPGMPLSRSTTPLSLKSPVRSDRNDKKWKPQFHKSGAALTSVGSWCYLLTVITQVWPPVNKSSAAPGVSLNQIRSRVCRNFTELYSPVTDWADGGCAHWLAHVCDPSDGLCPLSPCPSLSLSLSVSLSPRLRVSAKTDSVSLHTRRSRLTRRWLAGRARAAHGPHIHSLHTSHHKWMKSATTHSHSTPVHPYFPPGIVFAACRHTTCCWPPSVESKWANVITKEDKWM